jgi:multidrug efflux pump subunit AcrA (membrane-fusion protein)
VVHRGEVSGVYVVAADHAVLLRQVRLGHRYGGAIEVLSGLTAGERIALDPGAAMRYLVARRADGKSAP